MQYIKDNLFYIFFYVLLTLFLLLLAFFVNVKFPYEISSLFFNFNKNQVNEDIVVVKIDRKTLNSDIFPRYQDINRNHYSKVLNNIMLDNPRIVGLDVSFVGKSQNKKEDKSIQKVLNKFGEKIVLAREIEEDLEPVGLGIDHEYMGYTNIVSHTNTNIFGFIDMREIINKIPIYFTGTNPNIPLAFTMYKNVFDIDKVKVTKNYIKMDKKQIPLNNENEISYFNINYFGGKKDYNSVSFIDVYENRVPSKFFEDKTVFIGAYASIIADEFLTPWDINNFIPGVLNHVNVFNTLTSEKYIYYLSYWEYGLLTLFFIIIFIITISKSRNIRLGIIYSSLALILFIVLDILLFLLFGIFVNVLPIIVIYVFVNLILFLKRYFEERHYREQIRGMFSKYVSEDVVEYLISGGIENLGLGGTTRNITIFFSDLVGFTSLSEKLSEKELGRILNIYLDNMSSIILSNGGTIDKYIGDAIMAFWNAPLDIPYHPDKACDSAVRQIKALEVVKSELKDNADAAYLDTTMGINTGDAVVGNFGSSKRYDYTILGDSVNLASRLEGINKQYGTNIVISEHTYNGLTSDKFLIRELDLITVKGRNEPVRIYELIGYKEDFTQFYIENIKEFEKALYLYRKQSFEDALEIFQNIGDYVCEVFIERCKEFIEYPPNKDWDGVFRFKTK